MSIIAFCLLSITISGCQREEPSVENDQMCISCKSGVQVIDNIQEGAYYIEIENYYKLYCVIRDVSSFCYDLVYGDMDNLEYMNIFTEWYDEDNGYSLRVKDYGDFEYVNITKYEFYELKEA